MLEHTKNNTEKRSYSITHYINKYNSHLQMLKFLVFEAKDLRMAISVFILYRQS